MTLIYILCLGDSKYDRRFQIKKPLVSL
jgi:hypothetical protein